MSSLFKETKTHAYGTEGPVVKTNAIGVSFIGLCRSEKMGWDSVLLCSAN